MGSSVVLVGGIDVAELAFWAFVLFFVWLVIQNRREDRREGYPLENEVTGRLEDVGGPLTIPTPKVYRLPHNRGEVSLPRYDRDARDLPARQLERSEGAPFVPTGDPLVDGIGPASWCARLPEPDLDMEGRVRVVPLSQDPDFYLAAGDPDPRGWPFICYDGRVGGTINDIWIDRSDRVIRYYGVEIPGGRTVLAPFFQTSVDKERRVVITDSISSHQMANVPALADPAVITRREEDQIMAYYGGGYLYATAARAEPLL
ncbi:MAG: photosynthetic reaction center subunit H [Sphingomonadaceae bacterium]|nr:photosynthetic reaction center subunit H [Sphingomonadaceae bacterium]